ncbi:MAG: hypothetical protein KDD69_08825 [Bdellovibrionales bacterium]|nr:hypothetical protein [Bdellovibrionales bacterium]
MTPSRREQCAYLRILLAVFALSLGACYSRPVPEVRPIEPKAEVPVIDFDRPPSLPDLLDGSTRPPTPDEYQTALAQSGERWWYGKGVGRTMANVATVVAFPPYALYLLGNAGLTLAGYEPLHVTDALPEGPKRQVLGAYDGLTGIPGRLNALVAGREFAH